MAPLHRPIAPVEAALIAQACARTEVLWVRPILQERHHAAWHVWHDEAACVITGPGEQHLPALGDTVEVVVRSKESSARVVSFLARATRLSRASVEWEAAAHALSAARLNHGDTTEQLERWRESGSIWLFRPVNVSEAVCGDEDTPAGRLPVLRGPGTTLSWRPFHLGRRQRRARRQS